MTSIKSSSKRPSTITSREAQSTTRTKSTTDSKATTESAKTSSASTSSSTTASKAPVDPRTQADARRAAQASASPAATSTSGQASTPPMNPALAETLRANPSLKTNQDLINHCYKEGGGGWTGAEKHGQTLGVNLNELVKDRNGLLPRPPSSSSSPTAPAASPTTPPAGTPPATTPPATGNTPPASSGPTGNQRPIPDDGVPQDPPPASSNDPVEQARNVYVNQFDAEKDIGGNGANANCGPAALDMALGIQGLEPPPIPGVTDNGTPGAEIQRTRYAMYKGPNGSAALDGVTTDANGNPTGYAEAENSKYSSVNSIIRGAEASGATAERITASTKSIDEALASGNSVVVLGNFVDQATGKEKTDLTGAGWPRGGGATAHFVTVTGKTADGKYVINDPASPTRGPITVTKEQLASFMNNAQVADDPKGLVVGGAAVSIGNPNGAPPSTTGGTATTPAAPTTPTAPSVPQAAGGPLPGSTGEASPYFLSQVANTPGQPTSNNNNCGPTALAMTLNQQGKMPPGLNPTEQVQYARMLMTSPADRLTTVNIDGKDYPTSTWVGNSVGKDLNGDGKADVRLLNDPTVPLGDSTMNGIAQQLAGPDAKWQTGFDALDAQLEAGHPVVADGKLNSTYGAGFPSDNKPQWGSGAHFISIMGKTDDGKYIVMDPSTKKPAELTQDQLAAFFSNYGSEPHFIPVG